MAIAIIPLPILSTEDPFRHLQSVDAQYGGRVARAAGRQSDEVYQELLANAVPNSHFVAAGVLGATRAQEYGYAFMYASDED